jgi:hypothetical protein
MVNFSFVAPAPAGTLEVLADSIDLNVIKVGNFINVNSGFDYSEPRQLCVMCSDRGPDVNQ